MISSGERTDKTGAFHIEANLVTLKDGKAYLEKGDGEVVGVPLTRLSDKDLRHLASLPEQQEYFKTNPIPGIEPAGKDTPSPKKRAIAAIQTMQLGTRSAQTVAIAPDGSRVVVNNTYAVQSWGIKSGKGYPLFQDREIQWFATFLPNSRYLLSGGRGKVNLWEVAKQRKVYEFDTAGTGYVQSIAVSPDNRHFAATASSAGQDLQIFRMPAEVTKR